MSRKALLQIFSVFCCVLRSAAQTDASPISHQQHHSRALSAWPLSLPYPFAFPKDVAESAREADKKGAADFNAYAVNMCKLIAEPSIQGSREFRDMAGVKLWPIMLNVARAAYIYAEDVTDLWSDVFITCNNMGAMAAQGVGYGVAYIYAEGIVEAIGMTKILQSAYRKGLAADGDGCKAVNNILDIAAAVIKARDAVANELYLVMKTYSDTLAQCTPENAQQKSKPVSIRGDSGADKPRTNSSP